MTAEWDRLSMWTKCNRVSVGRSVGSKCLKKREATLRRSLNPTLTRIHLVDALSRSMSITGARKTNQISHGKPGSDTT